jgi:hypothetical protein
MYIVCSTSRGYYQCSKWKFGSAGIVLKKETKIYPQKKGKKLRLY